MAASPYLDRTNCKRNIMEAIFCRTVGVLAGRTNFTEAIEAHGVKTRWETAQMFAYDVAFKTLVIRHDQVPRTARAYEAHAVFVAFVFAHLFSGV